jgi:hypothetical protein
MPITMNRATLVYLCVFSVFALGIWVIVEMGSLYLRAARDMSGDWTAVTTPAPEQMSGFSINQSGRFLQLATTMGPPMDLIMSHASRPADGESESIELTGKAWHVTAVFPPVGDYAEFRFSPAPQEKGGWAATYRRKKMGQVPVSPPQPTVHKVSINAGQ